MAITLSLEGLASIDDDDRALAYIDVNYDGTLYHWQTYVPKNTTDLSTFLTNITSKIKLEIDTKEAEWAALTPKTREILDPITGQPITVPILKEEIVCPDVPDYYALRRKAYPTAGEQLEALWLGKDSEEYESIYSAIESVKNTYDKKYLTPAELQAYRIKWYTLKIQRKLDKFAKEKPPFIDMSDACTYASTTTVAIFKNRGLYCVNARANMWKAYYDILQDVKNNVRPLPSTFAALETELPALVWP